MNVSPFADLATLESRFAAGLEAMLEANEGLGVHILVLANAAYEGGLWSRLGERLRARHVMQSQRLADALRAGRAIAEPDDDLMVFLKLMAAGFDGLGLPESRDVGPWRAMFNPLRALRPPRASGTMFGGLKKDFNPAGFHFNKPFLKPEILWEGDLSGCSVRLLYNKFPFARFHGLLVPEPANEYSQCLTRDLHDWAWGACAAAGVEGLCLGYNSLGAGASVNHLHFQSFISDEALPILRPGFAHNGGTAAYPLPCECFEENEAAWARIEALHGDNQPYNLIYASNVIYVVPRRAQDDATLDDGSRGWGWSEIAGAVTLFSRDAYEALDADGFAASLARFSP